MTDLIPRKVEDMLDALTRGLETGDLTTFWRRYDSLIAELPVELQDAFDRAADADRAAMEQALNLKPGELK